MEIRVHVFKGGPLNRITDFGRQGLTHLGIPNGGCMDKNASARANLLVGNSPQKEILEICQPGIEVEFNEDACIAFSGAKASIHLLGLQLETEQKYLVKKGARIRIGSFLEGVYLYLAIRGDWNLSKLQSSLSDLPGQKMRNPLGQNFSFTLKDHFSSPHPKIPLATPLNRKTIRAYPGPEFEFLNKHQIAQLFSQNWTIGAPLNRMGCHILGAPLSLLNSPNMLSSGVLPGTVQLPPSGLPIALLAEAQTTGGYPRILQIHPDDLNSLTQLAIGKIFKFEYLPTSL